MFEKKRCVKLRRIQSTVKMPKLFIHELSFPKRSKRFIKLKQVPIKQQIKPHVLELLLSALENRSVNTKKKHRKGSDRQMFIQIPSPFKEMTGVSDRWKFNNRKFRLTYIYIKPKATRRVSLSSSNTTEICKNYNNLYVL